MIDIFDPTQLEQYLIEKGHCRKIIRMRPLQGGVSSKVVRVTTDRRVLVIKQSRSQLAVEDEWFADISRINVEHRCLASYRQITPESVPMLYFSDNEQFLYAMESVPDNIPTWKSLLMAGHVSDKITDRVISTIAQVHRATSGKREIAGQFDNRQFFNELRVFPYLRTTSERHPGLRHFFDDCIEIASEPRFALVHGDYSPKNILCGKDRIFVLDFEVAHYGNPAFDLAFLFNHLLLKAIYRPEDTAKYFKCIDRMWDRYKSICKGHLPERLERMTATLLSGLFLARADGKSPVEYLDENGKNIIRRSAYLMIKHKCHSLSGLCDILKKELNKGTHP